MIFFKDRQLSIVSTIAACLCAAVSIASLFIPRETAGEPPRLKEHLDCIIDLGSLSEARRALLVGYNYTFLEEYAAHNGQGIDIGVRRSADENYIDSLKAGSIDILVLPLDTTAVCADSIAVTRPLDSISVFLLRSDAVADLDSLDAFIGRWPLKDDYQQVRDSYLKRYNAFRSRQRETISPYDDIIKFHADSLGWDWRVLAAVVYQESRFHLEARSHRGASGLMQMMPRTAAAFGVDDPLDHQACRIPRSRYRILEQRGGHNPGNGRRIGPRYGSGLARHLPGTRDPDLCGQGTGRLRAFQENLSLSGLTSGSVKRIR